MAKGKPWLFTLLIFGILTILWKGLPFAQIPVKNTELLKHGVVKVTAQVGNLQRIGTGIVIGRTNNRTYIATASHVIAEGVDADPSPTVTFYADQAHEYPTKVLGMEGGDKDLAALLVEGDVPSEVRALTFDENRRINGGEQVTVIGFPRKSGVSWGVTEGTVTGLRGPNLVFTGIAVEGNSGGPLLLEGKVIGIIMGDFGEFKIAKPAKSVLSDLKGWPVVISSPENGSGSKLSSMVRIASGEFWMGSPEDEGDTDEHPRNKVYLDAFYMDTHEVTVSPYAEFMSATARKAPNFWNQVDLSRDGDKPIVGVSWYDANDFCAWAKKRLPTEAEWERTARGPEGRKYPWGSQAPNPSLANYSQTLKPDKAYADYLKPVGTFETSKTPEGVYDMAGNVWEWVADWYDEKYYQGTPPRNPKGPDRGETKVLRGGSWDYYPWILRSADRDHLVPSERRAHVGFRCARDAE